MHILDTYIQKAESIGLIEITTDRQRRNGTIMFKCSKTNDMYGVYLKNGYVRRLYTQKYRWNKDGIQMYQLNPKKSNGLRILYPENPEVLFNILYRIYGHRNNKK